MKTIFIKKGVSLPIIGTPEKVISKAQEVKTVAILGHNYRGLKPTFTVKLGSKVRIGQVVAEDKKNPTIKFVAPGSGKVISIERGKKRVFLSLIIALDGKNQFKSSKSKILNSRTIKTIKKKDLKAKILWGGLWPIFIQRPFGILADPKVEPDSIFVNAMDTNPLAVDPELIIAKNHKAFEIGLEVLARLTDGKVNLCKTPNSNIPSGKNESTVTHLFDGIHPAGLTGTHIHFIDPITSIKKHIWTVGYQDVIALGKFITTGKYFIERYISLAGPQVKNPRIIKTVMGANLFDLTEGELLEGENRIISGSVINGTKADKQVGFLGSYDNQVSVLKEGRERVFQGFMLPGFNKFSIKNIFASAIKRGTKLNFSTSKEGSQRDIVPIGSYEAVMPLNIIPTFLVRALLSNDLELAEKIGALELIEEDVALLTYVCPGKNDIGFHLMRVLDQILKENS